MQGLLDWISQELIEDTIRVWQPYYNDPMTAEEAVEIITNVGQLVDVIAPKSEADSTVQTESDSR